MRGPHSSSGHRCEHLHAKIWSSPCAAAHARGLQQHHIVGLGTDIPCVTGGPEVGEKIGGLGMGDGLGAEPSQHVAAAAPQGRAGSPVRSSPASMDMHARKEAGRSRELRQRRGRRSSQRRREVLLPRRGEALQPGGRRDGHDGRKCWAAGGRCV
jgi:hypothetical protein